MTLSSIMNNIKVGSVIDFTEYTLDRHGRKKPSIKIEGATVQDIIPANTALSRETLETYYGSELETNDYLQLSCMNCPRIVLGLGLNDKQELEVKIITLIADFISMGLQTVSVINEASIDIQTNYVSFMKNMF